MATGAENIHTDGTHGSHPNMRRKTHLFTVRAQSDPCIQNIVRGQTVSVLLEH